MNPTNHPTMQAGGLTKSAGSHLAKGDAQMPNIPKSVDGVLVVYDPDAALMHVCGEDWVTLRPADNADPRLWEYSLTTYRIIRTR